MKASSICTLPRSGLDLMKLTVLRVLKSSGTISWKTLLNKEFLKWYVVYTHSLTISTVWIHLANDLDHKFLYSYVECQVQDKCKHADY